jgi:hypothetical protein
MNVLGAFYRPIWNRKPGRKANKTIDGLASSTWAQLSRLSTREAAIVYADKGVLYLHRVITAPQAGHIRDIGN